MHGLEHIVPTKQLENGRIRIVLWSNFSACLSFAFMTDGNKAWKKLKKEEKDQKLSRKDD